MKKEQVAAVPVKPDWRNWTDQKEGYSKSNNNNKVMLKGVRMKCIQASHSESKSMNNEGGDEWSKEESGLDPAVHPNCERSYPRCEKGR